jgi:hypothetical protein
METDQELQTLERRAYLASYSDGIVDLFVGLSLLWMSLGSGYPTSQDSPESSQLCSSR